MNAYMYSEVGVKAIYYVQLGECFRPVVPISLFPIAHSLRGKRNWAVAMLVHLLTFHVSVFFKLLDQFKPNMAGMVIGKTLRFLQIFLVQQN